MNNKIINPIKILLLPILCSYLLTFIACSGDDDPGNNEPSAQEAALKKLSAGTWNVSSVMVDNSNQTSLFNNLTIKFNENLSFSSSNGEPVWPSSGTFSFIDGATTTQVQRSDGVLFNIQELTDTSLKLSLQWNKTTIGKGGRNNSVNGQHIFTLNK